MNAPLTPLTIAGGGIGGLSTALALAKHGLTARVLERGGFAEELGAGIQLGANAFRRLEMLGVRDAIEAKAVYPEALHIFDAYSGKRLKRLPFGKAYEQRYGVPYVAMRRADLAKILYGACRAEAGIELHDHFNIANVWEEDDRIVLQGPWEEQTELLIGADGLWSNVRKAIAPTSHLVFTGHTAARTMLAAKNLPAPFDAPVVTLWLGRGSHLVTYPVAKGEALNIVFASHGGRPHEGWNAEASAEDVVQGAVQWHDDARDLLDLPTLWRQWSLYRLHGLRRWTRERVALLGDAAHPVLPFMAQGAALAIEDAVALADALSESPDAPARAISHYEAMRRVRAARVTRQSARLGRIYHLGQPFAAARNLAISKQSPEKALGQFDWLYGA
ncbi:3-hydroxybenzoate 6-hydroxylase 1 [Methyloligella halotolerans]|uniref:3-hydroxybenzoate 6-hydroxylase 1 n=1 Tax=Methyloligella halotolerans TaxID=1177755 RepID=A0A1E2S169_9HYPH|nr:FAD-dependent monooxygenase [Methyloligella halotolerans]ODA68201.1 3-hydroxybenzoate 6-hydroxylase 1 [Methyloligella halotolerans]